MRTGKVDIDHGSIYIYIYIYMLECYIECLNFFSFLKLTPYTFLVSEGCCVLHNI